METVVSGIRSTGNLHLGNYFGAVQNFLKMQDQHKCYFFIADWHSLTTHPTPGDLKNAVKTVLIEYLASGLDPEKCTIYIQSDVPEIAELYLLLNMNAYLGELERCTSFKDKVRTQPNNVNAGLLTYPVLMATDILIHRAHKVPVGKDQKQHLEMARDFAQRFNYLYKEEFFPLPEPYNDGKEELISVPGLDGKGKMSKSNGENTAIFLRDDEDTILKKMKKAVTDSGTANPNEAKTQAVQNLFDLMKLVSETSTISHFEETYQSQNIRYGDMKAQLAKDMYAFVKPIGEKIKELEANPAYIAKVAKEGAEKARESAKKTLSEVRNLIGIQSLF